jgi:hypothetical protein
LLAALVERRAGGQQTLPMGRGPGMPEPVVKAIAHGGVPSETAPQVAPEVGESDKPTTAAPGVTASAAPPAPEAVVPSAGGSRRPARYGLSIQFEPRPDDLELARLVETTIWINESHPAYRRAVASRSEGYHVALATAFALAALAVEPAKEHAFLTTFLASWGSALERRASRRRK